MKDIISTEEDLRALYDKPMEGAVLKEKDSLTPLAKEFISQCPFLTLATTSPNGCGDCSPKGDPPGFVKVIDDKTIAIPDRKGNNRLDSLTNIIYEPKVGILFFIPGRFETLRVNGLARISVEQELLSSLAYKGKASTCAIIIEIKEVYFHCPKAFVRSKLWSKDIEAKDLHSYAKVGAEVYKMDLNDEQVAENAQKYKDDLKNRLY